jgi:hypothetical protein
MKAFNFNKNRHKILPKIMRAAHVSFTCTFLDAIALR